MKDIVKDTIQGRIMRALIILMMAVLFLGGLSLYTIFDTTNTFHNSSQRLDDNRNLLFEVKFRLEQVLPEFGDTAKPQKSKHAFFSSVDALLLSQAGRPWAPAIERLKTSFELLEASAGSLPREEIEKRVHELRGIVDKVQTEMTTSSEAEIFSKVRFLAYLIAVVAFGTIVIPAGTFWLTTQKINTDLSVFVRKLNEFSEQNDETSEVLRSASQSLAGASTQQSAAVQQSVSSITEMRSMLGETGNHVREVQLLTSTMNQKAQDGSAIMSRMESAMVAIEQANRQLESFEEILQSIRDKTQVINDIVFKTQLLSFNASIEAARAGQYGRGFAVVAEEVGKLAQMSGDASKEIDQLLGHSQDRVVKIVDAVQGRVSEGKDVASDASKRFSEMARQISTIAEKINQVGDASIEQARGVEETALAMDQMQTAATENRASSEAIYKVAEKLRDLSMKIRGVTDGIRRFVREQASTTTTATATEPEIATQFIAALDARPVAEKPDSEAVLDLVARIGQKRVLGKIAGDSHRFSADDPSFRKSGKS